MEMNEGKKEAWEKQFTVEASRVEEYVELYKSLGYEVKVKDATPEEFGKEECKVCFQGPCKYKVIYTRPKK